MYNESVSLYKQIFNSFATSTCITAMKDAVKEGKCKYLLCPNYKVPKFEINLKKEVDNANKHDELLLPHDQRINLTMNILTTTESMSRIPLLYADTSNSKISVKCFEEMNTNCKTGQPFIVLKKSDTAELFSLPEFRERPLKATGYISSGGFWIPSSQFEKERAIFDKFLTQWQSGGSPGPLEMQVAGAIRRFDSYHYQDPTNHQLDKYKASGTDGFNLIEIGYEDTQACIRYSNYAI
jgi:hypothetical protein